MVIDKDLDLLDSKKKKKRQFIYLNLKELNELTWFL